MRFEILNIITAEETGARPKGYAKDVFSRGAMTGDGGIELTEEAFQKLCRKYRRPRLGDWVEILLKPIARFIDAKFGTKLTTCTACQRRKVWLNRWF